MCGGKFRHYNFLSAIQHANSLEKDDKKAGRVGQPVIYHCDFCGAEHVGHLDKAQFTFPSLEEQAKTERDKRITDVVKSGKAIARQGKPTILFPNPSS
jgi:hypothetical protein